MSTAYYGKVLDINCPVCDRPMKSTLRGGGWSVDCRHMNLLEFVMTGNNPCEFDYYKWNPELQPTEEEAIEQHGIIRGKQAE